MKVTSCILVLKSAKKLVRFVLLTVTCLIKKPNEPIPPQPMLHKLQLCFKQPNRQY